MGKDNYKVRREAFKFWDLVRLILETLRYVNEQAMSHPKTILETTKLWIIHVTLSHWSLRYLDAMQFSILFNSLVPGKFEWNFRHKIFKQVLVIDDWDISCGIALTWKPQDLANDKSTLVYVMAWWSQATSHYLSQCWPSCMSQYGITRPQWVNTQRLRQKFCRQHIQICFLEWAHTEMAQIVEIFLIEDMNWFIQNSLC